MNSITKEIIENAQYGDHDSLNKILKPLSQFSFYKAIKVLGNREDAEECVQNILNNTAKCLHKYNFKDGSFINWCIVIIDNEISNKLRTRRRLEAVLTTNDLYANSYPDSSSITSDTKLMLSELEKMLGEDDYKILFYKVGHQLTFGDIAKIFKCSEITIKRKYYAAIKKSKEYTRSKK